jgi:hypothetical protein
MSFIILIDGRAYSAASWAYDGTVRAIAECLPASPEGQALTDWLLNQQCEVQGPGLGIVDFRELTQANQILLARAIEDAFAAQKAKGPLDWSQPEFWDGWITRFAKLVDMIHSVRRGETVDENTSDMKGYLIPATGKKSGPGW